MPRKTFKLEVVLLSKNLGVWGLLDTVSFDIPIESCRVSSLHKTARAKFLLCAEAKKGKRLRLITNSSVWTQPLCNLNDIWHITISGIIIITETILRRSVVEFLFRRSKIVFSDTHLLLHTGYWALRACTWYRNRQVTHRPMWCRCRMHLCV